MKIQNITNRKKLTYNYSVEDYKEIIANNKLFRREDYVSYRSILFKEKGEILPPLSFLFNLFQVKTWGYLCLKLKIKEGKKPKILSISKERLWVRKNKNIVYKDYIEGNLSAREIAAKYKLKFSPSFSSLLTKELGLKGYNHQKKGDVKLEYSKLLNDNKIYTTTGYMDLRDKLNTLPTLPTLYRLLGVSNWKELKSLLGIYVEKKELTLTHYKEKYRLACIDLGKDNLTIDEFIKHTKLSLNTMYLNIDTFNDVKNS